MKKTLIATAIAAAAISTGAFAEDMTKDLSARLDAMPTVYGNIQLAYGHNSTEETGSPEVTNNDFFDNGSTIGFKHEHEIAPGITGFMKAEFDFNADQAVGGVNGNQVDGMGFRLDEGYMGVKGGFGSVLIGSEDTVYEWVDVIDFTEIGAFAGEINSDTESNQLQYVSPTIAGGLKAGVSAPLVSDQSYAGILAAMYSSDMVDVALGYTMGGDVGNTEFGDTIGLGAKVKLNAFSILAQYETNSANTVSGTDQDDTELDLWALGGMFSMNASQFALGYRFTEDGAAVATETDMIFVQALHNVSDNMYVYIEADFGSEETGPDSTDFENFYVGAAYVF